MQSSNGGTFNVLLWSYSMWQYDVNISFRYVFTKQFDHLMIHCMEKERDARKNVFVGTEEFQ